MKTIKISSPFVPNASKRDGDQLSASEWNALSAAARDAQAAVNSIFADTVVLTNASQATAENKVYSVQSSIDLNSGTLTMPAGCTLLFEGGSISNGSLVLNNTRIEGNVSFSNVTISGSCSNEVLTPQMFGAVAELTASSNNAARDTRGFLNLVAVLGNVGTMSKMVHIPAGHYALNQPICIITGCEVYGDEGNVIDLYNGMGGLSFGRNAESNSQNNSCELLEGVTLAADAPKGSNSIELTDASGIEVGDYLIITDTADYSFCGDRASYRTSEVVRVRSIEENVVSLRSVLQGKYFAEFGEHSQCSLETHPVYRTVVSKWHPKRYLISGLKIVSHAGEPTGNNSRTYYSLQVCGHIGSEFKNIEIENYGNNVAMNLWLGADFIVEHCRVRSYAEYNTDAYGLSLAHVQDFRISDSVFRAKSHALSHGGANSLWGINNRNFVVEKVNFENKSDAGTNIEMDVHANAEHYKLLNIDAPHTMCDTGGYDVTVENCRFDAISTSFHQAGLTIRNCEVMHAKDMLFAADYPNETDGPAADPGINYEDYSIVIEGCKFHGGTTHYYDLQLADHSYGSFVYRNNICEGGIRIIRGNVKNVVVVNNIFPVGNLSLACNYKTVTVKGNTILNGVLNIGPTVKAEGVVSQNTVIYDGLSDEEAMVFINRYHGSFDENYISCLVTNKTVMLIYNGSRLSMLNNTILRGKGLTTNAIGDVTTGASVVFNNNFHNTSRSIPFYVNGGFVKCDKNEYHTQAIVNNAGVPSAMGQNIYFRNIDKVGYISNSPKGNMVMELTTPSENPRSLVAQNTLAAKTYYVKFRTNDLNEIYFSKTQEIVENELLCAVYCNDAKSAVFTAPDPTEYPYIYIKSQNGSVWFRFYENRNVSDFDGAAFNVARSGAYASRPEAEDIYVGFRYFCTDKQTTEGQADGIEIIWNGTNWVDALGRTVS